MNKKKFIKIIFILLSFFLYTSNVKAACTESELNTLKELAEEVKVSYEFDDQTKSFKLTLYNITEKVKVSFGYSTIFYNIKKNNKYSLKKSYFSNETYYFDVLASKKTNCNNEPLKIISGELPYYNDYFGDASCKGIEEYKLCRKWYNSSQITKEEFEKLINEYKNSNEQEKINTFSIIINYIVQNWLYFTIFGVLTMIIIAVKIIVDKKKKKIDI